MKFLNVVLVVIMCILGTFSVIALIALHWSLSEKYDFTFSSSGVNLYLAEFGQYKELFGGTILIVATFFGLHRLKAATDANVLKIKSDHFSEWKSVLDIRLAEIQKQDPFMKRRFHEVRFKFYEQLHNMNFKIENRDQLTLVFHEIFENSVSFFEEMNEKAATMAAYPHANYSYSFDSFRFVFFGCLDSFYSNAMNDLQTLYNAQLPISRLIDAETYQIALNNYVRRPTL